MKTTTPDRPRREQCWPLLGRDAELAEAGRVIEDPHHGGVLVTGPSGTGRSRLAQECWQQAGHRGHPRLRVTATAAARWLPLGALAPLLRRGSDGAPALDTEGLPGRRRPVLLLDDAHHLDDASARLLASSLRGGRIALVATTDARGAAAPWPEHALQAVRLAALPQAVVGELLERVLDGSVERRAVRLLHEASGGRPRDLRELVDDAVRRRALVPEGPLWRLVGPLTATPRLHALVESRLRRLDPPHSAFLQRLAVCGRLALDSAERASAEVLADEGWLRVVAEGSQECAEPTGPLYPEVLRAGLPAQRIRRILRDQAARPRALDPGPAGLLRSVCWRLEAADAVDPGELERAVVLARRAQDHAVTLRLARELAQVRPEPRTLLLLAEELYEGGHPREAERTVRRALDEATQDDDRLLAVVVHVQSLAFGLLRVDEALEVNSAARRAFAGHPDLAVLEANEAALWSLLGDVRRAERSLRNVPTAPGTPASALAAVPRVYSLTESSRTGDAVRAARQARAHGRVETGADGVAHPALLIGAEARALAESGALSAAEELARQGYDQAIDAGAGRAQTWLSEHLGWICYLGGRLGESRVWYSSVLAHAREVGLRSGEWVGLCGQALTAAVCGEVDRAELWWDQAQSLRPGRWWRPEAAMVSAWLSAATGRPARARVELIEAAGDASRRGLRTAESHLWCDAARLGAAREAVAPLTELAAGSDSALAAARADLARALATGRAGQLEWCAGRLSSLGAGLLAAEAWNTAATVHTRAGAAASARAARERALALTGPGGARTPGLVPPAVRCRLTGRELDVALAAASGLSSEEIARRLSLAVRTVVNHVQRICAKLEINDRRMLRTAIHRMPGEPAAG
ncbi:LuxR C-terminal-related transcriptional regulator [Streptomyces sp. NPDC017993]|uniref:LuxR C-terminal-related transcriptional regulator n=1 Tax=Streptomyces sp. NPDC017993 TaxID=3365027 RepID=UPI0037B43419